METTVTTIECGYSSTIVEIPYREKDELSVGDEVIFKDAEEREEYGVVKQVEVLSIDEDKIVFVGKVLRKATPNDIQKVESHIDIAEKALKKAKDLVAKYDLDMSMFRAGLSLDGARINFIFTSDDRVDFRELVKDLAKDIQKQIHLRQIGPRDKAKLIGGFGKCGRPLCCSTWLGKLESIGMEMVRAQALESKGSSKLSGSCGKLLCCLKYEVDAYKALRKSLPQIGALVQVKKSLVPGANGIAKVVALDILNQKLKVVFEEGEYLSVEIADIEKAPSSK